MPRWALVVAVGIVLCTMHGLALASTGSEVPACDEPITICEAEAFSAFGDENGDGIADGRAWCAESPVERRVLAAALGICDAPYTLALRYDVRRAGATSWLTLAGDNLEHPDRSAVRHESPGRALNPLSQRPGIPSPEEPVSRVAAPCFADGLPPVSATMAVRLLEPPLPADAGHARGIERPPRLAHRS